MENSIYKFTNLIYWVTEDPDDLNWADHKLGRNNQSGHFARAPVLRPSILL